MQLHLLQHGLSVASIIISERSENRDKVGTKIYLVIYIENSRTICQSWNVKSFKMSLVVHMGIDTNKGLISHPSWWGFCQTLSGGGGAFGTGAGQEFPLLLSVMNLLSFHPCCACNCSSCRADLLYETQDNFQHRSLALACFSLQPLTWHHVETPQNSLSSLLGQRHHSTREELQSQCFTLALSAVVWPLITSQWYNSKILQPKQTLQNPKLLVCDYLTWITDLSAKVEQPI